MTLKETQNEILEFFNNERQKLIHYFRGRVGNLSEMDIEDLLQDLIVNLFNKAAISKPIENLTAYIYRSIYNRIIDQLRKNKRTVSLEDDNDGEYKNELEALGVDPLYDIHREYDKAEFNQKLSDALDHLEPKQRAVWMATELEGYSFKELSEMWAEPIGTLLSRKHRATQALQKELQEFIL